MKKVERLSCMILVLLPYAVIAQHEVQTALPVNEVIVYLNGAEIRSSKSIDIRKGENTITFHHLTPHLQEKSVQVTFGGRVEIVSVATESVKVKPADIDAKIKAQMDTVATINEKLEMVRNQIDAYHTEQKTLLANQSIGSNQTGVSIAELTKAADFFRERTLKINTALTVLNKRITFLQNRLEDAQAVLNDRLHNVSKTQKQIIVVVTSPVDQKAAFTIRYLVNNAGWSATYDLMASDINKPVTLKYKAQVYNNTGIEWINAKMVLSTADPTLSASRPYLTTWTLNYTSGANEGLVQNRNITGYNAVDSIMAYDDIAVAELSTSFDIPKPYTIPSGGQPYLVELSSVTLNAAFEYLTIPKVDMSAFLIAKVTGWEKLSLIDGMANVYFGDTYIGESMINSRLMADTLELSLGRDNQLLVTRAKIEDKASNTFIGTKRIESFLYEIQVKNNRKTPVTVKVQDQVPISQESDITVEVEDISGANLHSLSGRLQWIKTIPAGESVKYRIAFSVKYPKGKSVAIRKQRVVRTPRYRN